MSTKYKKLYSDADIQDAKKDSDKVKKQYNRKSKRRCTVQMRVGKDWHTKLKELARSEQLVMSFLLDEMCKHFFKNYVEYMPLTNKKRRNNGEMPKNY